MTSDPIPGRPSRRTFLGVGLTGLVLGLRFPGTVAGAASPRRRGDGASPEAARVSGRPHPAGPPVFDLHSHPGLFPARGTELYAGDEAAAATVEAARTVGLVGAFFALVGDMRILRVDLREGVRATRAFEPGEAWADYHRQMGVLHELLDRTPARLAAVPDGPDDGGDRVAAWVAVEGGDVLEGRPDRVEALHADGVRSLQLVHYAPNELGDLQTEAPRFGGLSPVGVEVVREMNRLAMVVDVAHATFDTTRDVAEASAAPILLSHSLLRGDRPAEGLGARLITEDHARVVAGTGGVIGVWPAGGPVNRDLSQFVESTLRMVELVGVEHVGLGTDMDGAPAPVLADYARVPAWIEGLRAGGLSEEDVAKVAGGNALRLLREVAS